MDSTNAQAPRWIGGTLRDMLVSLVCNPGRPSVVSRKWRYLSLTTCARSGGMPSRGRHRLATSGQSQLAAGRHVGPGAWGGGVPSPRHTCLQTALGSGKSQGQSQVVCRKLPTRHGGSASCRCGGAGRGGGKISGSSIYASSPSSSPCLCAPGLLDCQPTGRRRCRRTCKRRSIRRL